jgi:hypothetical protein
MHTRLSTDHRGDVGHDQSAARGGAATPTIISAEDGLGIAEVGSVCLVVWRRPVVRETFLRQRAALEAVVARYHGRAGFVTVIETDTPPPDDELRKASVEMITSVATQLACVACVIEGNGFRAAATRSVLSGMALLLPRMPMQLKFVANIQAAGSFVESRCEGVSSEALCQAHRALRERLVA